MNSRDNLRRIQIRLVKKEKEADRAKEKGMHATYSNLMQEIQMLKVEYRRATMGGR